MNAVYTKQQKMRVKVKLNIWSVLAVLVISSTLFSIPTRAFAQTASDDPQPLYLTTSPLPISVVGLAGSTIKAELRVKNSGPKTEVLKVGLLKFSAYGEEGKPELKDREPGDDYFDWVRFSETQFTAEPDVWHNITMFIDLPQTAALGYYYAATFSRLDPPKTSQNNKLQGGTATLVLAEVKDSHAKKELKIDSFSTSRRIYEFLPTTFNIKINNTGNIHLSPTGNIFIKRGNKTVATLDVNVSNGNILPDSKRIFNAEWNDGFPVYNVREINGNSEVKDGKQVQRLSWDISKAGKLRIGRYTATLVMSYDDGARDIPLEAVVSFWVIPWRLIFAIVVPLIGVAALVYAYLRLRRRVSKLQPKKEK